MFSAKCRWQSIVEQLKSVKPRNRFFFSFKKNKGGRKVAKIGKTNARYVLNPACDLFRIGGTQQSLDSPNTQRAPPPVIHQLFAFVVC